jgi:hypothetical protein
MERRVTLTERVGVMWSLVLVGLYKMERTASTALEIEVDGLL